MTDAPVVVFEHRVFFQISVALTTCPHTTIFAGWMFRKIGKRFDYAALLASTCDTMDIRHGVSSCVSFPRLVDASAGIFLFDTCYFSTSER